MLGACLVWLAALQVLLLSEGWARGAPAQNSWVSV